MSSADVEVLVVGAGVAGLAAARDLAAAGMRPLVVDANPQPGGVMQTLAVDGYRMEAGPNTFQARASFCAFADRHDLWPGLVEAAPESRRRSIFRAGRLVEVPGGPLGMLSTPLLSTGAKLRTLAEPFTRRGDPTGESVHDFIARRLGSEVATEVVGAFLTGVYAGDERELGVEAVFPALAELERSHGSLARGGLAGLFGSRAAAERGRPGSWSAPDGLGVMAELLAAGLPEPVQTGASVKALSRAEGGWHVDLGDEIVHARHVVIATPAYAAARLLSTIDSAAAELLSGIVYAPVVALGFGVRPGDVKGAVEGFGFIAPRSSGLKLLGCLFMSRLFPGRAPEGHELLHVMAGGMRWPESVELPDDIVVEQILADLDRTLGLAGEPRPVAVRRWERAIPQPGREHVRQIAQVVRRLDDLPGLQLAGGYLAGVSVADTLASGVHAAGRVLEAAS
ncbi:MAG: protoporphyrinogen oxidase [Myxococcota bacterium]|nr:protoporphyrinogen oxidase [Myxococcota bacterium]